MGDESDPNLRPHEREIGTFPLAELGEVVAALQAADLDARTLGDPWAVDRNLEPEALWLHRMGVAVPAEQVAEALTVLRTRGKREDEKLQRHMRKLPRDLLRIVTVIAALGLLAFLSGQNWKRYPVAFGIFAAVTVIGIVAEVVTRRKRSRKVADGEWFDARTGRIRRR